MPTYNNHRSRRVRKAMKRGKRGREEPAIRRIVRENLRGARLLLGMTQTKAALLAGFTQSWWQQLEDPDGDECPTLLSLPMLAEALDCAITDLLTPGKFAAGLKINWRKLEAERRKAAG